jgi:nitronate monooxygenase
MIEENSLCKLLNIKYPIIQAGMGGGHTTPELVSAVSNAGALGVLGAVRMTPDQLLTTIKKIKEKTIKPFGVNIWIGPSIINNKNKDEKSVQQFLNDKIRKSLDIDLKPEISDERQETNKNQNNIQNSSFESEYNEQIKIILEEDVPVVSFAMGDPVKYVHKIHAKGIKVMSMVTNIEDAVALAKNGSDIIMAQGAEAGGHRSVFNNNFNDKDIPLIGTMSLVPQVVDSIRKEIKDKSIPPVVAAGGISDGRGLVAALALGAEGVAIGTRFLTCKESGTFEGYKAQLLSANETDTIITKVFTGLHARVLRNRFLDEYIKSDSEILRWPLQSVVTKDIYSNAQSKNNPEFYPLYSGQGLRMIKSSQSAKEIIKEIIKDAKEQLKLLCDFGNTVDSL